MRTLAFIIAIPVYAAIVFALFVAWLFACLITLLKGGGPC